MGQINTIKGNKKSRERPRKFMVSVTFDIWAESHEESCFIMADYLEWALTNGAPSWKEKKYRKPVPKISVEASEVNPKSNYDMLDNGLDFNI